MTRIVLDQGTRDWLARLAALEAADSEITPENPVATQREARRRLSDDIWAEFGYDGGWEVTTRDHVVAVDGGEIRVRQYRPAGTAGVLPGYLILHGGGFWLGTIDESVNRAISAQRVAEAQVTLFDVDYRLAPEHPFPAALDDAYSALVWIHAHADQLEVDPARIVVGGVSAGGNLAASLGQLARDRGGPPIVGQILEVPAIDLRPSAVWDRDLADANGIGTVDQLLQIYAGDTPPDARYLSPASGAVAGLPPTHVMTAEYDPLRRAAETYVADLREAGVDVSASCYAGFLHGSAGITGPVRGARLWHSEVVSVLREMTRG